MTVMPMTQRAPFPDVLAELVEGLTYKPGWTFTLRNDLVRETVDPADRRSEPLSVGLTLDVVSRTYNSHHPERGENYTVHHYMIVPPATFNRGSWQRWLLEQILLIERHEACEFLRIDGEQPYAPTHAPGANSYDVVQVVTEQETRTSFKGEVKP